MRLFTGEPNRFGVRVVAEFRQRSWGPEVQLIEERLIGGTWKRWATVNALVTCLEEILSEARRQGSS